MSRRLLPIALLSVVTLAGLVACSGGTEETSSSGTASSSAAEPVVIDHAYGSTELTEVPERIVAIGAQWTDTFLALGVEPVGYVADGEENYPWQDISDDATRIPTNADYSVPVEQIAALEPDLIVGSYSIADQETYDQLTGIAPTIPNLSDVQVVAWQDLVEVAGEVLGREDDAAEVIADVDAQVAAAAAELPGLAGKTYVLAQYVVGDQLYAVADEADGSNVFFTDLGLSISPEVVAEGQAQGADRIGISVERADLLQADLLLFLINGGDESALADIPGFDTLPGTVAILDLATIVGLNTPTPLSLPYALDALQPSLAEVAAG